MEYDYATSIFSLEGFFIIFVDVTPVEMKLMQYFTEKKKLS